MGCTDTRVLATLWPGAAHSAGWKLDFRNDDGNLLSELEVFCWACRRAFIAPSEGEKPESPLPEFYEDVDGKHFQSPHGFGRGVAMTLRPQSR
ncbi:hypothetical protein ACVWXU_000496 [Streptomyces sp. TE33382]